MGIAPFDHLSPSREINIEVIEFVFEGEGVAVEAVIPRVILGIVIGYAQAMSLYMLMQSVVGFELLIAFLADYLFHIPLTLLYKKIRDFKVGLFLHRLFHEIS
tara:strand:- start:626 stop:934 length:309 start_codon:yes stop_codon:yes gene_type:complete